MVDLSPEGANPSQSVLTEISTVLQEKGVFERGLSPQEVEQMMREIISGMIGDSGKVQASINDLSVDIADSKAKLKAAVGIQKPISANMNMMLDLENSENEGKLRVSGEPDATTDGGILAKMAIKKAKARLSQPNELIFKGLGDYLKKDGVQLQDMALTLGQGTLGIRLQSTV